MRFGRRRATRARERLAERLLGRLGAAPGVTCVEREGSEEGLVPSEPGGGLAAGIALSRNEAAERVAEVLSMVASRRSRSTFARIAAAITEGSVSSAWFTARRFGK